MLRHRLHCLGVRVGVSVVIDPIDTRYRTEDETSDCDRDDTCREECGDRGSGATTESQIHDAYSLTGEQQNNDSREEGEKETS